MEAFEVARTLLVLFEILSQSGKKRKKKKTRKKEHKRRRIHESFIGFHPKCSLMTFGILE